MNEELNTPQTEDVATPEVATPEAEVAQPVETTEDPTVAEEVAEEEAVEVARDIDGKADQDYLTELDKIMAPKDLENFDPSMVEVETLDQLISANQLKYVDAILAATEENKLIEDNAKDVRELDEKIKVEATKHAMNIENTGNPDYFEQYHVKDELLGPIQQIRVMIQKAQEIKIKGWKIEYRARLIARLREMKEIKNTPNVQA